MQYLPMSSSHYFIGSAKISWQEGIPSSNLKQFLSTSICKYDTCPCAPSFVPSFEKDSTSCLAFPSSSSCISGGGSDRPEILILKQESSIFRQSSNPVCTVLVLIPFHFLWVILSMSTVVHGSAMPVLHRPNSTESNLKKPHAGLDDCLNMLLACFRYRISAIDVFVQPGSKSKPTPYPTTGDLLPPKRYPLSCLYCKVLQ